MLYFASHVLDVDGGIMITGSHNPPDYNGFKMVMLGKSFLATTSALGALMAAATWPAAPAVSPRSICGALPRATGRGIRPAHRLKSSGIAAMAPPATSLPP